MSPGVVIEGLGKILAVRHQRHPPQYSDKSSSAVELVSQSHHREQRILRGIYIYLSLSISPFLLFSYPLPPPCNLICKHTVRYTFVSVFSVSSTLPLTSMRRTPSLSSLSLVSPSAILPVRRLTKSPPAAYLVRRNNEIIADALQLPKQCGLFGDRLLVSSLLFAS